MLGWALGNLPQGATQFQLLLNKQDALTEFDTLEPGRFQTLNDGSRVTYTEEPTNDRTHLGGVFIDQKEPQPRCQDRSISILVAAKGRQEYVRTAAAGDSGRRLPL